MKFPLADMRPPRPEAGRQQPASHGSDGAAVLAEISKVWVSRERNEGLRGASEKVSISRARDDHFERVTNRGNSHSPARERMWAGMGPFISNA